MSKFIQLTPLILVHAFDFGWEGGVVVRQGADSWGMAGFYYMDGGLCLVSTLSETPHLTKQTLPLLGTAVATL